MGVALAVRSVWLGGSFSHRCTSCHLFPWPLFLKGTSRDGLKADLPSSVCKSLWNWNTAGNLDLPQGLADDGPLPLFVNSLMAHSYI